MAKSAKEMQKTHDQLPAHLKNATSGRGTENVSVDDIAIPRIQLAQALSPCVDEEDDNYIEGISKGDIYNSLTEELYGKAVSIIPTVYRKEFQIWRSQRTTGSRYFGSYESMEIASKELDTLVAGDPKLKDSLEILDVPTFFVIAVSEAGELSEAVISFPRTKSKVARKLNSLIRMAGVDSFAKLYSLSSVNDESDAGKFYNFNVSALGFVSEDQYAAAEALYESVMAGKKRAAPETEVDGKKETKSTAENKM